MGTTAFCVQTIRSWVNNGILPAVLSSCFASAVKEKTAYRLTKVPLAQSVMDALRYMLKKNIK